MVGRGVRRVALGVWAAALVVMAPSAGAKSYEVTTGSDHKPGKCTGGDCTLREAVIKANGHSGADKVKVPVAHSPYVLKRGGAQDDSAARGDLDIEDENDIVAKGKGRAVIRQTVDERVLHVLDTDNGGSGLEDLKLTGGNDVSGGGLLAEGKAFVSHSIIRDNKAAFGGGAGVAGSDSRLNLSESTVTSNRATTSGGGVYISGPDGVAPTFTRTTISGNRADFGAGIYVNLGDANLHLLASTVAENIASSDGGGIHIESLGSGPGVAKIAYATIAANEAPSGAATASNLDAEEAAQVENTIVAQDLGGAPSCSAALDSFGHNLDADTTCGFGETSDIEDGAAELKPLDDYGGPTETKALKASSDAVGAGLCSGTLFQLGVDQRGVGRGIVCDIGAYERSPG